MIKKKPVKKFKPITALENFLKKFPSLFGILIPTIISAIALVISIKANYSANKQAKIEKIPLIDYQLIYGEDKTFLTEIKFASLKPNIQIRDFEIITPTDYPTWIPVKSDGAVWKSYHFMSYLSVLFSSYNCDPSEHNDMTTTGKVKADYPIAIRFNYIIDGKLESIVGLYIINATIYSVRKCAVNTLDFIKYFDKDDDIESELDLCNNTECLRREFFLKLPYTDSIIGLSAKRSAFIKWIEDNPSNIVGGDVEIEYNKDSIETYDINIPSILEDSLLYQHFKFQLDSFKNVLSSEPKLIKEQLPRIDSFFSANPFAFNAKQVTNWAGEERIREWFTLIKDIKAKFYIASIKK